MVFLSSPCFHINIIVGKKNKNKHKVFEMLMLKKVVQFMGKKTKFGSFLVSIGRSLNIFAAINSADFLANSVLHFGIFRRYLEPVDYWPIRLRCNTNNYNILYLISLRKYHSLNY